MKPELVRELISEPLMKVVRVQHQALFIILIYLIFITGLAVWLYQKNLKEKRWRNESDILMDTFIHDTTTSNLMKYIEATHKADIEGIKMGALIPAIVILLSVVTCITGLVYLVIPKDLNKTIENSLKSQEVQVSEVKRTSTIGIPEDSVSEDYIFIDESVIEQDKQDRGTTDTPKVKEPVFDYSEKELTLLAKCVQAEAGEFKGHDKAQQMITQVILNRTKSPDFPNTIRKVIYDKKYCIQFSVAYNGVMDKQKVSKETLANVRSVLEDGSDLPSYVLYFYDSNMKKDNWIKTLPVHSTVQGTVFAYETKVTKGFHK